MNKRIISVTFFMITMVILLYFICFKNSSRKYTDYIGQYDEIEYIKNNCAKSTEGLIESMIFDEQKLTFDIGDDTWYYSLKEDSEYAYNPYVSYKADQNVKLLIEPMEITDELIASNQAIGIIAYDDSTYYEYSLKCTLLPIMEITSNTDITEESTNVSMRLYDNRSCATQIVTVSQGTMRIRGASSRTFPKTSFRLSLINSSLGNNVRTNQLSLLGMRKDDDWILYSPYNDNEKIRNVFSANLWKNSCAMNNSVGVDNGNEYKYIELFLNGYYYGLYALGYPIDGKQLNISEGDNNTKREYIYKKKSWGAEKEQDYSQRGEFLHYEIVVGEEIDESWDPLWDYFERLYADAQTTNEDIYEMADIDNEIDVYLFFNLIQGSDHVIDSLSHNMYLSAKIRNGKYVVIYTPWDMDLCWGNCFGNDMPNGCNFYGVSPDTNFIMGSGCVSELINRGDEEIIGKIVDRYNYLRENEWSEDTINSMLEEYEEDIYGSGAYLREKDRWENGTYSNVDEGLDNFRQYVMERLFYMDEYIESIQNIY